MGFSLLRFGGLLSEIGDYDQIIVLRKLFVPIVPSPAMFALHLVQKNNATINSRLLTKDISLKICVYIYICIYIYIIYIIS